MRSKNGDLKKVKAISQVILDQRSDVEQFFLEALAQIKEEIQKKISAERKQKRLNGLQPYAAQQTQQVTTEQQQNASSGMSQGSAMSHAE